MDHDDGHATGRMRPKPLVDAARLGARGYRRDRDLPRHAAHWAEAERGPLPLLRRQEAALETMRRRRLAAYRPLRHLQVLIALIAEGGTPERASIHLSA